MASDQARQLRAQGIDAAKAGRKDEARQLLQQALRLEPTSETGWLWLASVSRDNRERLFCLQKLLEINPQNETGLKALRALGVTPEQLQQGDVPQASQSAEPTAPPTAQKPPAPPPQQQGPGVPVADPQRLLEAQRLIDDIVRSFLEEPATHTTPWVHKTKRRAGERDALILRIQVTVATIVFVSVLVGGFSAAVLTNPQARGVLFGPSSTPSPTATLTPTNTPGFTPTPSPTPELTLTPSPTIPFNIAPGNTDNQPDPTAIYPDVLERTMREAIFSLDRGDIAVALPTLSAQRENNLSFDANAYYYEALALAKSGRPNQAITRLDEATERLSEVRVDFSHFINSGYAQVYIIMAQEALAFGNQQAANEFLDLAQERAELAIAGDRRLVPAYIALAERHRLAGNFDDALEVLDEAVEDTETLASDMNIVVERAEILFDQGEFDAALYQAFLGIFINPFTEEMHELGVRSVLAQDDPGLAVIYAQEYLFFFPGSATGFNLLGDARVAEGNFDLALNAYSSALGGDENDPAFVEALISRGMLYNEQRRYDLAREDFDVALRLTDDPAIQAQRMIAAYNNDNFSTAASDAEDLLAFDVVPISELRLLRARILIDTEDDTASIQEALGLLSSVGNNLPAEQIPFANEYRARANLTLGNTNDALTAINSALSATQTGSRHYLRGQILEALEQPEEAINEYEWVLTWSSVYPYSFLPDARRRLQSLQRALDAAEG